METQGKKQVREAVATAVLCTLATGLVQWGVEVVKARCGPKKKRKKRKKAGDEQADH